jgi:TatD DNase family protein
MSEHLDIPRLVDSHCHLNQIDLTEFNGDLDEVMNQARAEGVSHCLCVCITLDDVPVLERIVQRYTDVSMSVGVHPNECMPPAVTADHLVLLGKNSRCVAVGETGLDYFRENKPFTYDEQRQQFREHIWAARTLSKPLIIHTREAAEDTLRILAEEGAATVGGVMHCFTENWDIARRALDLGFYISFSGIVTFKNATQLHDVAKRVPNDRFLIETDSPYLAPMPFRGKQNHPAFVKYVAQALSVLRNVSYETIAMESTRNFYECFKLNK